MSIRHLFRKADGRWIAAGMVAAYWMVLKATSLAAGRPIFELPPCSWFGPMAPYFADLRGVVSWSDQFYLGHTTHLEALRDPWNRPFNYHYWWLFLHELGVNGTNVMAFGYGIDLLFFAAAFSVLGSLDAFGGLVAGLFLISYAVMFGLERANVDLLIFALLALALAWRCFLPASALTVGFAAILKLHPLFAFGAFLRPPWKKSVVWLGAGLLFFGLGMMDHLSAFMATLGSAPNMHSGAFSFGMTSLGLDLTESSPRPDLYAWVLGSGLLMLILAAGAGAWLRPTLLLAPGDDRELFAFRVGAGSYLGCFLLGTNHDYRLVFLLFCLPLLLLLLRRNMARHWSFATLLLLLVSVNWLDLAGDSTWPEIVLKHGAAWMLFVFLTGLYLATLPPSLQWPKRAGSIPWRHEDPVEVSPRQGDVSQKEARRS